MKEWLRGRKKEEGEEKWRFGRKVRGDDGGAKMRLKTFIYF